MLIIDGHNVMNQMSELPQGVDEYWVPFITMMEQYVQKTGKKVILVLDFNTPPPSQILDIRCRPYADPLIKELLEEHKGSDTTLISSDRELVQRAHRFRCKAETSAEFIGDLRAAINQESSQEPKGKQDGLSESEVDEWMNYFKVPPRRRR